MKPKSKVGFFKHLLRGSSCLKQQMIHVARWDRVETLEEPSQQLPKHSASCPEPSAPHQAALGSQECPGWEMTSGQKNPGVLLSTCSSVPFPSLWGGQPCCPLCTQLLCCRSPAAPPVSWSAQASGHQSVAEFPRFCVRASLGSALT